MDLAIYGCVIHGSGYLWMRYPRIWLFMDALFMDLAIYGCVIYGSGYLWMRYKWIWLLMDQAFEASDRFVYFYLCPSVGPLIGTRPIRLHRCASLE